MRVPKTFYSNKFEVSFNVKNNQVFYSITRWSDDGTIRALLSTGKYNNENPKDLIPLETNGVNKS